MGGGGDDRLNGNAGNDSLIGGNGNDNKITANKVNTEARENLREVSLVIYIIMLPIWTI